MVGKATQNKGGGLACLQLQKRGEALREQPLDQVHIVGNRRKASMLVKSIFHELFVTRHLLPYLR